MPLRYRQFFWLLVKQKVESEMSGGKKAWKGIRTSLRHISVNPCDKFFQSAPRNGKKRDESWKNPKRGAVCHSDIYFVQLLVLIGQTEGRRRDEQWKRNPEGGNADHSDPYLSQLLPSILPIDQLDGWVVRQSGCVCNLDIQISVNYLVIGSEGKVKWAMEKKPKWYARHSNIPSPVNSCDQFLCSAKQTEEGVLGYPSGCISI